MFNNFVQYRIVIPTYERYDNFKTIDFLKRNNVANDMIDIFVSSQDQKEKYINSIGEDYNFIIGVIGLVEQRNFITDYYDEGQIILSIDDDIDDLIEKDNKPFLEWIDDCIIFMNVNNVGIIGINPSVNPFFYEQRKNGNTFKIGHYLIIGCFQILRNHKELKLNYLTEDWERSILYFLKYGNTGRYNNILIKTKYFAKKGGLSSQRNKDNYIHSLNCLLYKYPSLLKFNYKKLPLDKYNQMPNLCFKKLKGTAYDIIQLPEISASELSLLYCMLENIYIPKKTEATNRRGFPLGHQSTTFGMTRARFKRTNGNIYDLSSLSIKYPEIYNELLRIGNIIVPFKYTSIHINKNVICPSHKDSKNIGKSLLLSFGDYTGCNIVINGESHDANLKPIIFNGAELEHYNTNDLQGIKYSLVYFNGNMSNIY
jgi:hypothetical protein